MRSLAACAGCFLILLGSYAYFWHARDWNCASRLMLTYALVDRGTVRIDGLERHTNDIAFFQGHYYTDKLPGFSLLAVPSYIGAKATFRLPDHPLGRAAFKDGHWPADYWVTLGASGLASAITGALLCWIAIQLGCGPKRGILIALAYGLATPAYVYATLSYGHQLTSFLLLLAFVLLWKPGGGALRVWAGGVAAALAPVVELQVAPAAAILSFWLVAQVIREQRARIQLLAFALGAVIPIGVLLAYNAVAFGSPFEMGYFHERLKQFADVHSARNPLGLQWPDWSLSSRLLWGEYRGLFFYAPILLLAIPGWVVLLIRRRWDVGVVSILVCLSVFAVNLSYPNWEGGWSTGPRLLLPLVPFAMIPVSALLAERRRAVVAIAAILTVAGAAVILAFQAVGGRIPADVPDPLHSVVWPLWRGDAIPAWREGVRFDANLASWLAPRMTKQLEPERQWLQFLPLVVTQFAAIAVFLLANRSRGSLPAPASSSAAPTLTAQPSAPSTVEPPPPLPPNG